MLRGTGGDIKRRVIHAERREELIFRVRVEALSRNALDEIRHDVEAGLRVPGLGTNSVPFYGGVYLNAGKGQDDFRVFAGFLFHDVEPDPELLDRDVLTAAAEKLAAVEPFAAEAIEAALKDLCERLGLKPRQAFAPIRVAVTGSKVSPGLYESLELLGRDESLARISRAAAAAA